MSLPWEQVGPLFTVKVLTPLSSEFFSCDTTHCRLRHPSRPTRDAFVGERGWELAQRCFLLLAALLSNKVLCL